MHFFRGTLQFEKNLRVERWLELAQQFAPVGTPDQLALVLFVRVTQFDAHQETIEL